MSTPRPPRVRVAPSPDDPPLPRPETLDVAVPTRERPARRLLMGEIVGQVAKRSFDPTEQFTRRERAEKARQLLRGGRNKGADKGYGIAPPKQERNH